MGGGDRLQHAIVEDQHASLMERYALLGHISKSALLGEKHAHTYLQKHLLAPPRSVDSQNLVCHPGPPTFFAKQRTAGMRPRGLSSATVLKVFDAIVHTTCVLLAA